ncbi:hypothetical protein JKP88DRAFT_278574 [Tribonema minus]|uniref:Uncharacterized protein n=1 Tax=Tribonema minus TaxID=303371 RepID=A0A835YV02_9STRA|nr:hypothetical protein JKP88DRAFT_278574 [Tribonema minus]
MLRVAAVLLLCAAASAKDPYCKGGVSPSGKHAQLACCAEDCGSLCGAKNCEAGGRFKCCPAYIKASGRECDKDNAPCVKNPIPRHFRTCKAAQGILGDDGMSCCAASCGVW